ncbi:MAG: hypothetical protein KAU07_02995 [Candidatus Andersenbacteria bacterium]|nr:hypothetical protein [Candidatus Andersenbacteria bacterium]
MTKVKVKVKGERRKCLACGTETNNKFCPECGEYAPIKMMWACPYCRIETNGVVCPKCKRQAVSVDKNGFYNAYNYTKVCTHCGEKTATDNFCSCGEQTINIHETNWTLIDDANLFLKNLFTRSFKKNTSSS